MSPGIHLLMLSSLLLPAAAAEVVFPAAVPGVVTLAPASDDPKLSGKPWSEAMEARDTRLVLVPAGTWTLRGPLEVRHPLVGAGSGKTVLRILPALPRKAAAGSPVQALRLGGQRLQGITIEVQGEDPAAVGIVAGDGAQLDDVVVVAAAGGGIGISLADRQADDESAPDTASARLGRVRVRGFAIGVKAEGSASLLIAECLELTGQRERGLVLDGACAAIRRLTANGPATVVESGAGAVAAIDGAVCIGEGASAKPAILNAGGLRLRDISARGYAVVVAGAPAGTAIAAWSSHPAIGGGTTAALEVRDTPDPIQPVAWSDGDSGIPGDFTTLSWGRPTARKDHAVALQAVTDAGAEGIWLSPGREHALFSSLRIGPRTRVLDGLGGSLFQVFHGSGERYGGSIVVGDGDGPFEIRDLGMRLACVTIHHVGKRPLVLRRTGGFRYVAEPGAGDLYLEGASPFSLRLAPGQHVWARGLAIIDHRDACIAGQGASFWALGLLSARWTTLMAASDGMHGEILGGLVVARSYRPKDPLFVLGAGSSIAATLGEKPGSPLPYDVIAADPAGAVLVGRDAAPRRDLGSGEHAAGSMLVEFTLGR